MSMRRKGRASSAGAVLAMGIALAVVLWQQRGVPSGQPSATPNQAPTRESERAGDHAPEAAADRASTKGVASAPNSAVCSLVRIGSWNIEWLGLAERRSGLAKGVAQHAADLADYVIASGVSILAVQEIIGDSITTTGPGRTPRSTSVDAMLAAVRERTGEAWEYVLFAGRGDDDQLTGVLWNTSVVTALDERGGAWDGSDAPRPLGVRSGRSAEGSRLWNRPPHAMRFRTGQGMTDMVVIPIHMKADYNGAFAGHRADEAAALVDVLPRLRREWNESDIVVAGDTNVTMADEAALGVFTGAGLRDMNAAGERTNWQEGSMDRVFVPLDEPEFAASSVDGGGAFEVISDGYLRDRGWRARDFKRAMSDHYMVVATVRVMKDDD